MLKRLSTEHLANASARHPKRTVLIWLAALVIAFVTVGTLFDGTMTTEFFFFNNPESKKADSLLEDRLRGPADVNEAVIVRSFDLTVDESAYQGFVSNLQNEIAGLGSDFVASEVSYYQTGDESMVSNDRRTTILPIVMAGGVQGR